MSWVDLGAVFLLGLLGSGHCIGMCGAFALAVSAGTPRFSTLLARHVCYQLGKATSYLFLAVVLLVGSTWLAGSNPVGPLQTVLGWVVGLAMILLGLAYALEWRAPVTWSQRWAGSEACRTLGALWRSPSLLKSVLAGWVNGFLPCGLSLMAILYLVGTNSAGTVVVGAYVFGLATLPGLLAMGWLGQRLGGSSRRRWLRLGGVALIGLGVLTLVRGDPRVHGWFHDHLMPATSGAPGHHGAPGTPHP